MSVARLGGIALVVLFLGVGIAVWRYVFPGATQVFVSDSPDGRYWLVMWEQVPTPRPLMQSPYRYRCELYDRRSGAPMSGSPGVLDNDSAALPPGGEVFRAAWDGNHVTFMERMLCDFSAGRQDWARR
jgi:hypothetical protein